MLEMTKKNMEEEQSFMYRQTHRKHMDELKDKEKKLSPNGGHKPFKSSDDR